MWASFICHTRSGARVSCSPSQGMLDSLFTRARFSCPFLLHSFPTCASRDHALFAVLNFYWALVFSPGLREHHQWDSLSPEPGREPVHQRQCSACFSVISEQRHRVHARGTPDPWASNSVPLISRLSTENKTAQES